MLNKMHSIILVIILIFCNSALAEEKPSKAPEPFSFADFTWLNGNSRQTEFPLDSKYFTGEFSMDTNYVYDFNYPKDHSLSGTTNMGRTSEIQVQQLGVGGDFHYQNVRGRFFTQFGMYSTMTPRNDATTSRGQWNIGDAYKYISEANAGYHWDIWSGINLDAGLFLSYLGLGSYYNYENWIYQFSYMPANTPWYLNGIRLQVFPNDKLKLEFWLLNGWGSYGMANSSPSLGLELLYRPTGDLSLVSNEYWGHDTIGVPNRMRIHTDHSVQLKYRDNPKSNWSKAAFSFTVNAGCENGDGVSCIHGNRNRPSQNFWGAMAFNRFWFSRDQLALTIGGGFISNPGRYLVVLPPINGATASTGSAPYFTANPGDQFRAWDAIANFDFMPKQFITFRLEFDHRAANTPYFSGKGGVSIVNAQNPPDLSKIENRINAAILVRL